MAARLYTNSAEGYFSIFNRGLAGIYQHMSEQHLERHLADAIAAHDGIVRSA